jgi:adenosylmethionine-8-amino-7-oxononanoate aminotransferase
MPERQADIRRITALQQYAAQYFANFSGIDNARALGTILAFDVIAPNKGYLSAIAPQIGAFCLARGVVIRPLGNVVYVLPPYCTTNTQLEQVYAVLEDGIKQNWSV